MRQGRSFSGVKIGSEKENTKEREEIRLISWNIAGIKRIKGDAWKHLKGFDVICLKETWLKNRK